MGFLRVAAKGFGAVAVLSTIAIAGDIYRQRRSRLHTLNSLLRQYVIHKLMGLIGARMRLCLERDTRNCRAVQEEILLARVREAAGLAYGRDHGFAAIGDREAFRRRHPLIKYEHVRPYVERVAAGEAGVLTRERPVVLGVTSGTAGPSKVVPTTKGQSLGFFTQGVAVLHHAMRAAYPGAAGLQKTLKFFYTPTPRLSPAGIPVGPNSSSPKAAQGLLPLYTTPPAGYDIAGEPEALYVHLVFALRDRDLGMIEANFASLVHTGFAELERRWPALVRDIRHGQLTPSLRIEPDVRRRLERQMAPDPVRAEELQREFQRGFEGIAKRIWPHLNLIAAVDSGPFQMYGRLLSEHYTKGIPTYSALYAATEGLLGVNIWPESDQRRYLLAPRSMFFEFIPVEKIFEDQPETLFIDQVSKGCTYELVITNAGGLYRFRLGDVVEVVDLYNECPVVEVKYRKGQYLNVRGEKTSEDILYRALTEAVQGWTGLSLVDYSCAESPLLDKQDIDGHDDSTFPYYLVFVELAEEANPRATVSLSDEQKEELDQNLRRLSFVYNSFREKGSIAPASVHVVRRGSFKRLKRFSLKTRSVSINQFKVPRVMRRPEAAKFLCNNIA